MKVLLFITGHRQLEEYNYFSRFLKRLKLNAICDIFIHCNNPDIHNSIVNYYQNFNQQNKKLFITSINAGYRVGPVEAISEGIELGIFKDYDYVIRLNPDVFIVDDNYLTQVLVENLNNDVVFLLNKSVPHDPKFFSFDFFIFKPKLLTKNIFLDELYSFTEITEHYFYNMIMKYNIKYIFVKRFNNDTWEPRRIDENLHLWHEHDLNKVQGLLHYLKV